MVVAWRDTPQESVSQAVKVLRTVGAPLSGIVLNKTDLAGIERYDGKRHYAYKYRYKRIS